jgi:hypothetical protein
MNNHTFIDRYFHSQQELLDITKINETDVNSLFTYLNNLHSTADKLKDVFGCNIKDYPDFRMLRIIRNYFHHVGDIDETRLLVTIEENVVFERSQHLIIPLETLAKAIKSFIDNSTVPENHKQYKNKLKYVAKEMSSISTCWSYCDDILNNMDAFCNKPSLKLDGVVFELGFDMFRFIINVTNLIADKCRELDDLAIKPVIQNLDPQFSMSNQIGKIDMYCSPNKTPITTTQGMVYAKLVELAI